MFNSQETIKAYQLAQESIEVITRYDIESFEEIDVKLRYYHSMKGAGQKEEHTANTDSEYSAAMQKIAESTEAIRALYKLQKDIERSETVLTATLSFLEKYKKENAFWLEKDALYEVLSLVHNNDYWPLWKSDLGIVGAILFAMLYKLPSFYPLSNQAANILFQYLPYVVTIIILIIISIFNKRNADAPKDLGITYFRENR